MMREDHKNNINRRNYQKELEQIIAQNEKEGMVPSLFLHSCCAPCSSYVLEYLSNFFNITVYYYNPNIFPSKEYEERAEEVERLVAELPAVHPIHFQSGVYNPTVFMDAVKGHESDPEGGARCEICFKLRLRETARLAALGGYDYFTTTLSISPLKDAQLLNTIGEEAGAEYGVHYLNSDFKKKNGYKRSIELSEAYQLYRQNYCGCIFSKRE
ncbi:MAG: epoxyqueuosine reductase QueH [Clostridium sp.]